MSTGDVHVSGPWTWALMDFCKKNWPSPGLTMGLDKPLTKCGNCERGEPQESNISRLYVEMGV